ncbi:MAG: cardiolipin synthase [Defluviitaleaceae bacterium]|nr:cardiolipin synthase [Defluviitaleaceae bacterium]
MKNLKISGRLFAIVSLIVLQMVFAFSIISFLLYRFPHLGMIGTIFSIFVLLSLVKKDKPSAYKLIWVIFVLAFPILGGFIYLFLGDKKPTRKIAKFMREHAIIQKILDESEAYKKEDPFFNYITKSSGFKSYENTDTKYYNFGEKMFEDMILELEKAQKFIFLEYFIIKKGYMWETMLSVLTRKASENVEVKLILDDFGTAFSNKYLKELRQKGIKVIRFNPLVPFLLLFMNNRDHRKIMIIDGEIAFCGGMNISDEYINKTNPFGKWKDTGLMLKGQGVWSFTLMFIEMWDTFSKKHERINDYLKYKGNSNFNVSGKVLPFGDTPIDNEELGENTYVEILNRAKDYVYIFTPYLIVSDRILYAFQMAAKRGVDVRIVLPGIPDKKLIFRLTRSYYRFLIGAGVKIYEYTPGFLHAKSFVSDDKIAVVGTINLDFRSLYLHFECAVILENTDTIMVIKEDVLETIEVSNKISRKIVNKRKAFIDEFIEAILHLFSPLL